jgi:hypothetical protein
MNRYRENTLTGRRYNTTVYPNFAERESDYYIFSHEGDRLDLLANAFYGDPSLWWVLAQANYLGKGSLAVQPGLQIRIPFPIDELNFELERVIKER